MRDGIILRADVFRPAKPGSYPVLMAADTLRWTTSVVLGGFVFLFAPFLAQDLPASIKETRGGLALVVAAGLVVLAAMFSVAQGS